MKHSAKISLAVFAVVFITLSLSAYKKQDTTPKQVSPCSSKICKAQMEKFKNNTGSYNGAFLPDNIISEN